ncbi:MAG: DUF3780 domain-containing protein [Thermaerobacter sp.]|nr:DUF3780 domain-containing protein [Thermaerobacter sp.]
MSLQLAFSGFGAPDTPGTHTFRVEIEPAHSASVRILEDFGYAERETDSPGEEERVVLERRVWSAIAEAARREFNDRLKAARIPAGRWRVGDNPVDRLLGKELCVLAWAAETASDGQIPVICRKWAALRPEERWWLYSATVAEAGLAGDTQRGWRRALSYALSDGEKSARGRCRAKESEHPELPLFEVAE